MKTMNLHDTWRNDFTKMEWVMNVVSPITEVHTLSIVPTLTNLTSVRQLHPYAKMAWGLLSMIPQVDLLSLLSQECTRPSLIWMPDFLETGPARWEDLSPTWCDTRCIWFRSLFEERHTTVRTGKYSYPHVAARLLLHWLYPVIRVICREAFIGEYQKTGEVDKQIADLCNTLVELQKAFMDRVTVTTEITVVQILDNVGTLLAKINLTSDHLDVVTTQLSDLGM
jgi:hypothetical protein